MVRSAKNSRERPARRLAALQLVEIGRLFRLVMPCQSPRGTHSGGRPTAVSRLNYAVAVYLLVVGTLGLLHAFYGHAVRPQTVIALVAGALILIRPNILNYVVGVYLILHRVVGFGNTAVLGVDGRTVGAKGPRSGPLSAVDDTPDVSAPL